MESPEAKNSKEEISNDNIIRFFEQEHDWSFDGPLYTPAELPEVRQEYIEKGDIATEVGYLRDQLLSYVIKDQFDKDETSRAKFWDEIRNQKGKEFVAKTKKLSKLVGGNHTGCSYTMQMIIRKLEKQGYSEIAQKLEEVRGQKIEGSDEYSEMEFNDKIEFAKEFDAKIHRFLEVLS